MKIKNHEQGFIPLVAALVIGLIAIAGGTAATIAHNKEKTHEKEQQAPQAGTPVIAQIAPVSAPVTTKAASEPVEKKTPPKAPVRAVAETPAPKPVVIETLAPAVPPPAPKTSPAIAAIDTFLASPTIENLRTFCSAAKNLEGYSTVKVMNADRTSYETKKKTLYEETGFCGLALGEAPGSSGYVWTYYSEGYLLPLTDQGESDLIRKKKLDYNAVIAGIPPARLFGYDKSLAGQETATPREVAEAMLPQVTSSNGGPYRIFLMSFITPEKKLTSMHGSLVNNP